MSLSYEERQYLRKKRSDHVKSLRRRDSRMLADVTKSMNLLAGQLDQEEKLVGQVQSDD